VSYKHLKSADRIVIDTLLGESRDYAYIARRLGVNKSTIGREISRNAGKRRLKHPKVVPRPAILDYDGRKRRSSGLTKDKYQAIADYNEALAVAAKANKYYYAGAAGKKAKTRRKTANQLRVRLVHGSASFLEQYVLDNLTYDQWSPEQIAGRLTEYLDERISPQTIYSYIYTSPEKKQLVKHLRQGGNKYRRKHGTIARVRNNRNNMSSIHDRDPVVETRTRLNDYEGDTVVGLDTKDRLLTYVDRTSGECLIGLVLGFNAVKIANKTSRLAKTSGSVMGTITYDRGIEFAEYEAIAKQTNSNIYFADAYSSWQRGTNENLNGLLRQYFPKRSDFKDLTQKQVTEVQDKLNNRPRKRYNYRTPIEQRAYLKSSARVALRV
jgi:IS30 family transposase